MKKTVFTIIAIVFSLVISCKKDDKTSSNEQKIPVTFSVSGFSTSIKGITAKVSTDSIPSAVSNLSCNVYDVQSGALVETLSQTKENVNFGTLTFNLPPGTYSASVAASGGNIQWGAEDFFSSAYFHTFASIPHQTFFKRLDSIIVTGPPVTQDIALKRIVSGLEVIIEDAIPASVSKILLTVENEALHFKISGQQAMGYFTRTYPFNILPADINTLNKSFGTYLLPNTVNYKMKVRIKAINAQGQEIIEKIVSNVVFEVNKKTVLQGKLFDSLNSGSSFTISIDTEWDGTLPIVYF